jgi:hypothetical protein
MAWKSDDPIPQLATSPLALMWQQFYGIITPPTEADYEGGHIKLHISAYSARLRKTLLPMFKQANRLGAIHGLRVVLRLVGFGLGVWAINDALQQKLYHQVVFDIIEQNSFEHISRVDMLWMGRVGEVVEVYDAKGHIIRLVFSKGNPADPVQEGELIVATYAWDGNSFVGNEYWLGMLSASGDPAAAASSTIPQMQNPRINKCLTATNNLAIHA